LFCLKITTFIGVFENIIGVSNENTVLKKFLN